MSELVFIGKNDAGTKDLAKICPRKGTHRYRLTVWALSDYLGSGDNPLDPNTPCMEIMGKKSHHDHQTSLEKVILFFEKVIVITRPSWKKSS